MEKRDATRKKKKTLSPPKREWQHAMWKQPYKPHSFKGISDGENRSTITQDSATAWQYSRIRVVKFYLFQTPEACHFCHRLEQPCVYSPYVCSVPETRQAFSWGIVDNYMDAKSQKEFKIMMNIVYWQMQRCISCLLESHYYDKLLPEGYRK